MIQRGNAGPIVAPDTLAGAFKEKFFATLEAEKRPATIRAYRWAWAFFDKGELGHCPLSKIDSAMVAAFTTTLQSRDLSKGNGPAKLPANPSTVNMILKVLNVALHKAEEWNLIMGKLPKIHLMKAKPREYVITPEREQKLLADLPVNHYMRRFIPFLVDVGLRIGEACFLLWENVDFKRNVIRVRETAEHKLKTEKAVRDVPMSPRVRAILLAMKGTSANPHVWTGQDGTLALNQLTADGHFRKMKSDAKITDRQCVLHSCRHTFGTNLGNNGVHIKTIMYLMGHADISTCAKYLHPDSDQNQKAIAAMAAGYAATLSEQEATAVIQ